jgi:hypothetical protein
LERLISRLPLPFWLSSLLLAIFFGPPGFLVYRYLDTGKPFNVGLESFFHDLLPAGVARQVAGLILWTLVFYLSMILPRYIRVKIQQAEAKISPLAPQGIEGYRNLFQPISYSTPPILLAVVLMASFTNFISTALVDVAGPLEWLYHLVNLPLTYLAIGSIIWAYFAALWGLFYLGRQPLNLKNAYEDSSLGAKPVGSLSLSISYAYFGLLGLVAVITILNPIVHLLGALLVILTGLGLAMFLLPLLGVRRQMLKSKQTLQAAIRQQWLPILAEPYTPDALPDSVATLDELFTTLEGVQKILLLEAAERKAHAVSTWPFDTTILGKLAAIILSILVAIITSRIIKLLELL